jgi:preprotein translocase subunit SecB
MKHLKFLGLKVSEINFRINEDAYATGEQNFKLNPKIRMDIKQNPKNLFLTSIVTIDKHQDTVTPFELTLVINTSFEIETFADINTLRLEAADFAFPYVRAAMSQITSIANLPAYYLPIIDFSKTQPNQPTNFGTPPSNNANNAKADTMVIRPLEEI